MEILPIWEYIGKKIKEYRIKKGLSRSKMAQGIRKTAYQIRRLEEGHITGLTIMEIFHISSILNMEPSELFGDMDWRIRGGRNDEHPNRR